MRVLIEKYTERQNKSHCVFVHLEKAYDRVSREELWYYMRKLGVTEKYTGWYKTRMRTTSGISSEPFPVINGNRQKMRIDKQIRRQESQLTIVKLTIVN